MTRWSDERGPGSGGNEPERRPHYKRHYPYYPRQEGENIVQDAYDILEVADTKYNSKWRIWADIHRTELRLSIAAILFTAGASIITVYEGWTGGDPAPAATAQATGQNAHPAFTSPSPVTMSSANAAGNCGNLNGTTETIPEIPLSALSSNLSQFGHYVKEIADPTSNCTDAMYGLFTAEDNQKSGKVSVDPESETVSFNVSPDGNLHNVVAPTNTNS